MPHIVWGDVIVDFPLGTVHMLVTRHKETGKLDVRPFLTEELAIKFRDATEWPDHDVTLVSDHLRVT